MPTRKDVDGKSGRFLPALRIMTISNSNGNLNGNGRICMDPVDQNCKKQIAWLYTVIILILGAVVVPSLSLGQSSKEAASKESKKTNPTDQSQKIATVFLEKIRSKLPNGWSIKGKNNDLIVSRDKPIEWYGTISLPSHKDLADLKAQGFVQSGNYTITLEFFPPMSKAEVEKLTKENERIEENYYRKHPQPKNSKPLGLPKEVRESLHHIPNILAKNFSVLLTPFIQGPGEAFFNEQEKKECEGVEQAVTRLLKSDE